MSFFGDKMKNTGVSRKIDELGRIVIPKEIRNSLDINSYDLIEINIENNNIVLSKYKAINEFIAPIVAFIDTVNIKNLPILIVDNEKVVYSNILDYKENDLLSDYFIDRINSILGVEVSYRNVNEIVKGISLKDDLYIDKCNSSKLNDLYIIVLAPMISKEHKNLIDLIINFIARLQ